MTTISAASPHSAVITDHSATQAALWRGSVVRMKSSLAMSSPFHASANFGGEAILPYHYGGSNGWLTEGALATRFFRRLGASNLDRTYCAAATSAAAPAVDRRTVLRRPLAAAAIRMRRINSA